MRYALVSLFLAYPLFADTSPGKYECELFVKERGALVHRETKFVDLTKTNHWVAEGPNFNWHTFDITVAYDHSYPRSGNYWGRTEFQVLEAGTTVRVFASTVPLGKKSSLDYELGDNQFIVECHFLAK